MEEKKDIIIFAIDIEARGQGCMSNGIVSIGVCIGRIDNEVILHKERFDLAPIEGQCFEQRCVDSFWSKHPKILEELSKNAIPPQKGIEAFRALLDKWDSTNELYIVCDNPGFDFGMINYYLDFFKLPTLNYKADGSYRNTHDADSYNRGVLGQWFDDQWFDNNSVCEDYGIDVGVNHDHMPENDAELIYRIHLQLTARHNRIK